jgi:hypothetical protein
MIAPTIFSPSRIHGLLVAAGRASWVIDEKDKGYYSFVDADSFSWKINQVQLQQLEIDEQDVLDCVLQAEKQFGSPEEVQRKLGIQPGQGWLSIGATFASKDKPNLICVYTPTSMNFPTTAPCAHDLTLPDAYFEFYYSPVEVKMDKPEIGADAWFDQMEKLMPKQEKKKAEPQVPSYEEASAFTMNVMNEDVRERFLQDVWNYHKFAAPGFKPQLAESILSTWKRVGRVQAALNLYTE